jgi:type IV secretion system protein TrbE
MSQASMRRGDDVRSMMELLPWAHEIAPGVVLQKDDSLLQVFEYQARDIEGLTWAEIDHHAAQWEQAARLAEGSLTLQLIFKRRHLSVALDASQFVDPMAAQVDSWWRDTLAASPLFANRHFVAFHQAAPQADGWLGAIQHRLGEGAGVVDALRFALGNTFRPEAFAGLRERRLTDATRRLCGTTAAWLGSIGGVYAEPLIGERLAGFLKTCASPASGQTTLQDVDSLDAVCGCDTLTSAGPRLWQFEGTEGTRYAALLTLAGWPSPHTWPALLEPLYALPHEVDVVHTFRYATQAKSRQAIRAVRRYNESRIKSPVRHVADAAFGPSDSASGVDPGRQHNVRQTLDAEESLTVEKRVFGYANVTLVVWGTTPAETEAAARKVADVIQSIGFGVIRETLGSLAALRGSLPGSSRDLVAWQQLHTGNLFDAALLRTEDAGSPTIPWWTEQMQRPIPAVTILPTHRHTAVRYSPLVGSLGHFFVIGPPGNGKTTLTNFLASQMGRVGARIFHIDKDHSTRVTTLTHGGDYVDFGAGDVEFNPLALLGEPRHHSFLQQFVRSLLSAHGYTVNASDGERIAAALAALSAMEPSWHHLEALAPLLGSQVLQRELEPWLPGGALGRYFGGRRDTLHLSPHFGIELGKVLDDPIVAPRILLVLFYRLRDWLDQTDVRVPTLIDVQEARYFIQDPQFRSILIDFLTTIRRKMGMVALSTQSVQHLQDPAIWASIADTVMTRWFTANPQVRSEEWQTVYRQSLGLGAAHIEAIGAAVPMQDYVLWRPNQMRTVRLALPPHINATLRGDKRALSTLDRHLPQDAAARRRMDWRLAYIEDVLQ